MLSLMLHSSRSRERSHGITESDEPDVKENIELVGTARAQAPAGSTPHAWFPEISDAADEYERPTLPFEIPSLVEICIE